MMDFIFKKINNSKKRGLNFNFRKNCQEITFHLELLKEKILKESQESEFEIEEEERSFSLEKLSSIENLFISFPDIEESKDDWWWVSPFSKGRKNFS